MTTDTRDRIRTHVYTNPGIHFNALVRDSAFAPGQVQYHLHRLLRTEELTDERLYGRTHYYPPTHDPWERRTLALVRRETARELLTALLENEGAKPGALADELGIARSTLEWHTNRLIEQGIVRKERDARNRVRLSVARPDRTTRLLADTTDSLPDRFADRFMRLVDDLLDE